MLIFKSIKIENFQSISNLEFNFSSGVHLVSGLNGAGKSTLFEALLWAVYGEGRDKDVSTHSEGNCSVNVSFQKGKDNYIATRYCKHPVHANKAFLEKNGVTIDSNVDDQILIEVGISYEAFTFIYVIMQGLPVNFSSLTPTARKGVLEDLFNFTCWPELKKRFDSYCETLNSKVTDLEPKLTRYNNERIGCSAKLENIEKNLNLLYSKAQATNGVDDSAQKLEVLREKGNSVLNSLKEIKIEDLNKAKDKVNGLLSNLSRDFESYATTLNTGKCSLCQHPFSSEKMQEASERLEYIKEKSEKLRGMLDTHNLNINKYYSLNTSFNQIKHEIMYLESKMSDQKNLIGSEILRLEEEHKQMRLSYNDAEQNVNNLSEQLSYLRAEFLQAKGLSNLMLPSSDFRTKILLKYLDSINKTIEQICNELYLDTKVELAASARNVGIDLIFVRGKAKVKYKTFSAGERRMFDIILIQAFRRFMFRAIGVDTNLTVFDEVFDGLDNSNVDVALSVINQMYTDGCCVYVISHKDMLKAKFDSIINISINRGISEVNLNGTIV